jgi:hypothetical protein
VWKLRPAMLVLLAFAAIVAVALPIYTASSISAEQLGTGALLASLSIAYSLWTLYSERARLVLRKQRQASVLTNMQATWTFPIAILLPPQFAAILLIIIECFQWPSKNIEGRSAPHRAFFSGCVLITSATAAHTLMELPIPFVARLAAAALTYEVVTVLFIGAAVAISGPISACKHLIKPSTHLPELLTLSIGAVEVAMVLWHVPLVWLSLPLVLVLQRRAVRVETRGDEQSPIAPMGERVWSAVAREVVRACTTASVLRVDSDDPVAARSVAQMQAGCDAIGTVGASGLVILLADCPGPNADSLALRLRSALSSSGVQANVAVASKPRDGQVLEDLLAVTEAELITRDAATRSARSVRPDA